MHDLRRVFLDDLRPVTRKLSLVLPSRLRDVFRLHFSAAALASAASGAELPAPAGERVDFTRDVKPLIEKHCIMCHGPEKQRADLRLDRRAAAMQGVTDGPVIVPGKSAESRLIAAVAGLDEDLLMPPKGERLSSREVGVLRRWIDDGASWPEDAAGDPAKRHWSFQSLARPMVPGTGNRHPIDAYSADELRKKGRSTSAPAGAGTIVRRMFFDVIGLPPSPEEMAHWSKRIEQEPGKGAAELADHLLSRPQYGERWARHWLDVARFAESSGFETNQARPNAWPYRDYVIRSLNEDKPFDRFIREQLAGDILGAPEATGFIVGGAWDGVKSPDPVLTANQRADELHDMVGTTGSVFLGLTVNCARCHNHKFDPISQTDYFAMKAVFAGVKHGEREIGGPEAAQVAEAEKLRPRLDELARQLAELEPIADPGKSEPRRVPVNPKRNNDRISPVRCTQLRFAITATNNGSEPCIDELEVFDRGGRNVAPGAKLASSGNYRGNPKHKLEHLIDGRFGNDWSWISDTVGRGWVELTFPAPVEIGRIVWGRDREEKYRDRVPADYLIEVRDGDAPWTSVAGSSDRGMPDPSQDSAIAKLEAERSELEKKIAALMSPRKAYAGVFGTPEPTKRFHRGDPMQPREDVAPGGLAGFGGVRLAMDAPDAERRRALADWIASPRNALTARVIVNRLWHYHFGTGIVDTPSDFGLNGGRPTHPELLDWLASELVEHGWSLKHIHRLILTSATYRQTSAQNKDAMAKDGSNRLLWRYPGRRLEAEALRDGILAVSGKLDLRMYGPGFDLFEPNNNYVKVYATKTKFGPDDFRRMVYQAKPRSELDTLFGAFDCPDAGQVQPKRTTSTTPLQALNLLNSEFLLGQSDAFAGRLRREAGAEASAQIRLGYALAFGRAPETEELDAAREFIQSQGLPAFCRALYNANEFVMIY